MNRLSGRGAHRGRCAKMQDGGARQRENAWIKQRALARPAGWYLPLAVAAALVGCGSSSSGPGRAGEHSVAGVKAAGQQFLTDLQSGHYSEACKAFTAAARASLAKEPLGCAGTVPYFFQTLNPQLSRWFARVLPKIQVQGNTALFKGVVEARYEQGRWHLENAIW